MLRRAEAGAFPGCAPLVREAFGMAATGKYSGREILTAMERKGLRSRNGGPISHGNLIKLLRNPFYMGWFRFDGREYAGSHEPLVSEELFKAAQRIPDGRARNA